MRNIPCVRGWPNSIGSSMAFSFSFFITQKSTPLQLTWHWLYNHKKKMKNSIKSDKSRKYSLQFQFVDKIRFALDTAHLLQLWHDYIITKKRWKNSIKSDKLRNYSLQFQFFDKIRFAPAAAHLLQFQTITWLVQTYFSNSDSNHVGRSNFSQLLPSFPRHLTTERTR